MGLWALRLKINQDGFSDAPRMRKRVPKDPRKKPSGLQETFKRPKISRRWSQERLTNEPGRGQRPAREIQNGTGWDQERSRI